MNRLSKEKSPYLSHAADQQIDWYPWSEEAFERAKRENKPVFLSSGAVWCHWCHVMAKECFENEEVASLLNENFISVKLDRDEKPDIDRRYQQAMSAIGAGGGWPLSVFLTPEKKPFFGGTYFPPEDSLGRPGFKKILKAVAELYRSKKEEVTDYSQKLVEALKAKRHLPGNIEDKLVEEAASSALSFFDPQNGGFGSSPKFPMPGAIEFLINRYFYTGNESLGFAVKKSLESMAKGGFHDQIGGGFHRYSVDEAWIVPHFEKMADDNAWLLRNYIDAYAVFGDDYFRNVALGIMRFVGHVLSAPEGGFYVSQDADVVPEDEGGYFTWTDEDFRSALSDEELRILSMHLMSDRGVMHHDESKKVLIVAMEPGEIAERTGLREQEITRIINEGKEKLLNKRNERTPPFIDRTFYTSLNGMMITSYLKAFRHLRDVSVRDFALKSLRRIYAKHFIDNQLFHTENVPALLDDHIYLTEASISAYEVTGESGYLDQAVSLMESCVKEFWDADVGGFFDTESDVIEIRIKGVDDVPNPSPNSLGIILLMKLHFMTEKKKYLDYAEAALKIFSSQAKDMGIHSAYYFCAIDAYFNLLKFTIQTSPLSRLAETALSSFYPYTSFFYEEDRGRVIPCLKDKCFAPIDTPEGMKDFLKNQRGSSGAK